MKKVLLLLILLVVSVFSFWGGAGPAQAAGTITFVRSHFVWGKGVVFIFEATDVGNKDLKDASIFIGSNYHHLSCSLNEEADRIPCVLGGGFTQYAGQIGVIYLNGLIFYVEIPQKGTPDETTPTDTCTPPNVLGADVTFMTFQEGTETFFVAGETLAEVENNAEDYLGEFLVNILEIGDLYCGQAPQ